MKKRFLLGVAIWACSALVFLSTSVYAVQIQLDFSADITESYGDLSESIITETLSGYLIFDASTPISWQGEDSTAFDFWDTTATLYVEQLDASFDVTGWTNYYGGEGYGVNVDGQYSETGFFMIDVFNYLNEAFFEDMTSLPTDIDQTYVDNGDLYGDFYVSIDGFNYGEFYFTITVLEAGLAELPAPVLNDDGELLLGGDGLASGAQINEEDADLITSKTTIGYEAYGSFVQTGGLHQTDELCVGGDPDLFESADGDYTLTGGTLETGVTQVGYIGTGDFTQTGGTHTTRWLMLGNVGSESSYLGPRASGVGTYNMVSGTLDADEAYIGAGGQGIFNQSGGVVTVGSEYSPTSYWGYLNIGSGSSPYDPDDFDIPDDKKRYGVYNLSGGQLIVNGSVVVGDGGNSDYYSGGTGGVGYFNQSGGTSTMHDLNIGDSGDVVSGEGCVTVSNEAQMNVTGTVNVGVASESAPAKATFVQIGGTVNVDEKIIIGESDAGEDANAYRVLGGETTALGGVEVGSDQNNLGTAELEVGSSGVLNADVSVKSNGILFGSDGTIVGDVSLDGGMITPGNSPGTMIIDGDLILNDGTLQLEIYADGEQDLLEVSGLVYFGDDALIDILLDYIPEEMVVLEDFFDIDGAIQLGEDFDTQTAITFSFVDETILSGGEVLTYSLGDVTYSYTYGSPVPLPSSAVFLIIGLAGLIGINRRQYSRPSA
nr:hypothetical protein [uncultured Desulfobacter sp.]